MGYLTVGLIWCWWLEYYTVNNVEGLMGKSWVWRERIFHTLLWPLSLSIFLVEFFKNIR